MRRKFGIKEGTRIQINVSDDEKEIILTPITREYVHSLRGQVQRQRIIEGAHGRQEEGERTLMPRKPKAIVLDSWAVIAYLEGEAAAEKGG